MPSNFLKNQWWKSFYDRAFVSLLLVWKDQQEIESVVSFLVKQLKLKAGDRVFDQCCGVGSLSIPLAKQGIKVVGVDISPEFIIQAKKQALDLGLDSEFHCDDAFKFVPKNSCDAAFNWHTSFGYSQNDEHNILMLKRVFEALKPGGHFILDFPNMAAVLNNFERSILRHVPSSEGDILLIRESTIDLANGMLDQLWTILMPDGKRIEKHSSVRIYLPHMLKALLEQCGFTQVELYSNFNGEEISLKNPRCICKATKP